MTLKPDLPTGSQVPDEDRPSTDRRATETASTGFSKLRHDLRTCVNQILGYSELLKEEAEDVQPDFVPDLDHIREAAHRLLQMLDGIFADGMGATPAASSAGVHASEPGAPSSESESDGASVLVVDDNEMNRDMLSRRLARQGYNVTTAEDGHAALRLVEEIGFDVILLDVMMPGLSGLEVLQRIREKHSMSELPVIMATAKGESEDIVEAFGLGANDYVTKPIDFPVVLARTRGQVRLKRAVDENRKLAQQVELRTRFIRQTFGRYLSEDVVASLLESRDGLLLGGEKRGITIMMTDLRGFSAISERLPPERVLAVINNYLGTMTRIILECGGTIDEFIGDAILVLFGAPIAREDHAVAAVDCAVRMQRAMEDVNRWNREQELPEVEMGIGIHSGEVVVGNIGSEQRAKYGVVGRNVNLAGRIESFTVGGQILISSETRSAVGDAAEIGIEMQVHPKGFREPLQLYEVVGAGGLALSRENESLISLAEPIPVRFSVLEGKRAGSEMLDGEIVRLSRKEAEIRSATEVTAMENLRLLIDPGAGVGDSYAKVLGRPCEPGCFPIRFTALDPESESRLVLLLE